jgi:hypothetical protein
MELVLVNEGAKLHLASDRTFEEKLERRGYLRPVTMICRTRRFEDFLQRQESGW